MNVILIDAERGNLQTVHLEFSFPSKITMCGAKKGTKVPFFAFSSFLVTLKGCNILNVHFT